MLQGFREGANLVLAAVNAGRPSNPDWFRNLATTPEATVELKGRSFRGRAEQLSDEEAASWWPRILLRAPTYELFLKASGRAIPLVRLVPIRSGEEASS
jgi:deazaflavin-dependent oxidoreductase (nitroreductase family)